VAFLGQEEQIRELQERFRFLYAAAFFGLGLLLCRLVYLQVLQGDKMRQFSEENRIKRVKIASPRGMLFDSTRKLLVDNRPSFDLEIIPQYLRESKESKRVLARLSKLIRMSETNIQAALDKLKHQPAFMPVKIKEDLTRDEVAAVESWKIDMPGVEVREEIKRTNLFGEVASHLLGYIGEVSPTELPALQKKGLNYKLGDSIGRFGLEQRMEDVVRGEDGEELKEVDALGRIKREGGKNRVLSGLTGKPAEPGKNLILTIDQDLQMAAAKAMEGKAGGVVAVDPRNGEVLAMLSTPSFDPTLFSRGIPANLWTKLLNDPNRPLRDKTIQDHYPPGSTYKIVTAIAGLEEGVINQNTRLNCSGSLRLGNRPFHCHKKGGHGDLNVVGAIQKSCDIFFYKTAMRLQNGADDIAKWAFHLGLGKRTGITLPRETSGLVPTVEWKKKRFNQEWIPGETVMVAIGQSYNLVTGIQLANLYAAIANGGTVYRPQLVKEIESYDGKILHQLKPEILGNFRLQPKTVELVKEGLWGVVNLQGGTAYAQRLPGMDFAGKSGTVQVIRLSADKIYQDCKNMRYLDRHHGIFVGFAPANDPVISVAVIVEHGCSGSGGAAPVVRSVIKTYLEKYYPDIYGEKVLAARLKEKGQNTYVPSRSASTDTEDIVPGNDDLPLENRQPALPAAPPGPPVPPSATTITAPPGTED
jgi:penicillin-binding protein 2